MAQCRKHDYDVVPHAIATGICKTIQEMVVRFPVNETNPATARWDFVMVCTKCGKVGKKADNIVSLIMTKQILRNYLGGVS